MRVHHINCGTMCPYGGHLFDGESPGYGPARLSCHCLLIEAGNELVLVDTGLGTRDVRDPGRRIPGFFLGMCRPRFDPQETAIAQIRRLGFNPEDVRHVVMTHLDFDHAGGLDDFPQATVHLFEVESRNARERRGPIARRRFRPQQWQDSGPWREYPVSGERWFGFETVRGLQGLPPEILMIPLPGHTAGHCGIAVQEGSGWQLLAGDAFFHHSEIESGPSSRPPLARVYQTMLEVDRAKRLGNQARLRDLARDHRGEVDVFCSHDPSQMDRLARV